MCLEFSCWVLHVKNIAVVIYYCFSSFNLVCDLSEDVTDVPKRVVVVVRDYTDMFVISAFVWFCERIF
jgi:hypothetical protein